MQVWSTVLFFVGWIVCLQSERLDTLAPIIRKSPAASVNSDDFFSYAIALHQIDVPTTGNFKESLDVSRLVIFVLPPNEIKKIKTNFSSVYVQHL